MAAGSAVVMVATLAITYTAQPCSSVPAAASSARLTLSWSPREGDRRLPNDVLVAGAQWQLQAALRAQSINIQHGAHDP